MNEWVELYLHDIQGLFIGPWHHQLSSSENKVELELPKWVQENIGWWGTHTEVLC